LKTWNFIFVNKNIFLKQMEYKKKEKESINLIFNLQKFWDKFEKKVFITVLY